MQNLLTHAFKTAAYLQVLENSINAHFFTMYVALHFISFFNNSKKDDKGKGEGKIYMTNKKRQPVSYDTFIFRYSTCDRLKT